MDNLSRPYQDELSKALIDPEEAAAYMNAATDEGSEELFLLAFRNIGEARNLKKIAGSKERLKNEQYIR